MSPRYEPGDLLRVSECFTAHAGTIELRLVEVRARRLRDIKPADTFNVEAWTARHGAAEFARNPWCWCLKVRRARGG